MLLLAGCSETHLQTTRTSTPAEQTGTLFIIIQSDAEGIEAEITKVTADDKIIEDTPVSYTLAKSTMIASTSEPETTYKQITIELGKVRINNEEAIMPSNKITINTPLSIQTNKQTALILEIQKEESTYKASQQIFAPVIKLYTINDASTLLEPNRRIKVTGQKQPIAKIGMNEKGITGIGMNLPKTSEIIIENGKLKITPAKIILPTKEQKAEEERRIIKMTAVGYAINPVMITAKTGEKLTLAIKSIDKTYGIFIDGYNIKSILAERNETLIEFTADKPGTYQYYCKDPCIGKEGKLWGKLIVR